MLVRPTELDFKLHPGVREVAVVIPAPGITFVRRYKPSRSCRSHASLAKHAYSLGSTDFPANITRPRLPKKCVNHIFRFLHRLAIGGPAGLMVPTVRAFLHHVRDVPAASIEYPHWCLTPAVMGEITRRCSSGDDPHEVATELYHRYKDADFRSGRVI